MFKTIFHGILFQADASLSVQLWVPIRVQVTIYRWLRSGRAGHLDHSEAYDIYRNLYENKRPDMQMQMQTAYF